MAKSKMSPRQPTAQVFDREVLRELARCYARAAVDELIANGAAKENTTDQPANEKRNRSK